MAEVTYYFNNAYESNWTDPAKMVDGILTNYAYTAADGAYAFLPGGTCPGNDLGTISKVELRVYGYGDGDDRIDLTPYFTGGYGDEHQNPMPSSAGWSGYNDITNDPNSPSPWTWADVKSLCLGNLGNPGVEFDKVGKGNTMHCAKVEIRVTYAPVGPPPAKVTQYLVGLDLPGFPHEMDLISDKLPCPPPY